MRKRKQKIVTENQIKNMLSLYLFQCADDFEDRLSNVSDNLIKYIKDKTFEIQIALNDELENGVDILPSELGL